MAMGLGIRASVARISSRSGIGPRVSHRVWVDANQLRVKSDGALGRLGEVAQVKALVLGVGVGVGILDADEQRRRSAPLAREGMKEGDRPAAPDGHRLRA